MPQTVRFTTFVGSLVLVVLAFLTTIQAQTQATCQFTTFNRLFVIPGGNRLLVPRGVNDYATVVGDAQGNPDLVSPMVLRTIRTIDPNVQATIITLEKSAGRWLWFSEVGATLSSTLGLIGLLLASAGIYGLIAYSVEQRTHELGIRVALGADRNAILKLIVGQGLRITLWGMGIGLGVAVALTRTIAAMLYGVRPTDALTFAAVVSILTAVALAAAYLPARRAAKADPIVALRCE